MCSDTEQMSEQVKKEVMILFLFLIQLVRSRCGVLLYVVQLRLALLLSDSWGAKMVKPSSQCLNGAYLESPVKGKECHTALRS